MSTTPSALRPSALTRRRVALITAAAALGSVLSGCIVVPAHRYGYDEADVVAVAPPPPQVEVIGVAPGPGYFWIGGFWTWVGGRHVWQRGHWEPGRPGYRWTPHQWQRDGRGWRQSPGHWDRDGNPRNGDHGRR